MRFSRPGKGNAIEEELKQKEKEKDGLVGELASVREGKAKLLRLLALIRGAISKKKGKPIEEI